MNNKFSVKSLLLITGLLLTSACIAESMNRSQIANHCHHLSNELMQLVHGNRNLPCSKRVKLSAKYLELAESNIQQNKIAHAFMQVSDALKELNSFPAQTECTYFRMKTKPYLLKVSQLRNQIQLLDR